MSSAFGDAADHGVLAGLADDDHAQYLNLARHSAVNHDNEIINHAGLEGVTANQHHNENHASRHAPGAADESTDFLRAALSPQSWIGGQGGGARALNTVFQPSATRPVWVSYSVQIKVSGTTVQTAEVELRSGPANPPTQRRVAGELIRPAGIVGESGVRIPLTYIVPAGHFVTLVTLPGIGTTATFTLMQHTETPL